MANSYITVKDFTTGAGKRVPATQTQGSSPDNITYTPHHNMGGGQYKSIAAGQTDSVLGASGGAVGDCLAWLHIIPGTTGAGSVSIKDGSGSSITVFTSGTLTDLHPISLPLFMVSTGGAWSVTTGGNVTAIAVGNFT